MGRRRLVTASAVLTALLLPAGALADGPAPPKGNPDNNPQLEACGRALEPDRQRRNGPRRAEGRRAGPAELRSLLPGSRWGRHDRKRLAAASVPALSIDHRARAAVAALASTKSPAGAGTNKREARGEQVARGRDSGDSSLRPAGTAPSG